MCLGDGVLFLFLENQTAGEPERTPAREPDNESVRRDAPKNGGDFAVKALELGNTRPYQENNDNIYYYELSIYTYLTNNNEYIKI